jgi:hypothetical protein
MRGCLLNPFEGFTTAGHPFIPGIDMSGQEFGFWMWRVAGIRVQIAMSAVESDEGEPIPPLVFDRNFFCPLNPLAPSGPICTEEDQARRRIPFSSTPQGAQDPIQVSEENFSLNIDWGRYASKFPGLPDNEGWAIIFEFTVNIFSENGISSATATSVNIGQADLTFQCIITGEDLPLNTTYLHDTIPVFGGGTNVDAINGLMVITPILFYEWKEDGVALFDQFTGAYA